MWVVWPIGNGKENYFRYFPIAQEKSSLNPYDYYYFSICNEKCILLINEKYPIGKTRSMKNQEIEKATKDDKCKRHILMTFLF